MYVPIFSTQTSESINAAGDFGTSAQSKSKGVAVLDENAVVDKIMGCLDPYPYKYVPTYLYYPYYFYLHKLQYVLYNYVPLVEW